MKMFERIAKIRKSFVGGIGPSFATEDRPERRAAVTGPMIPATPVSASNFDGSGTNILFTTVSDAGVVVNEWTGLAATPVFAAISLISDTLGYLDMPVYQSQVVNGRRSKMAADNHSVADLLARPNEAMTGDILRTVVQSHALGWGNGYVYIERNPDFSINALIPLLPDRTWPFRMFNGELIYRTRVGTQVFNLAPYEVMPIKGFTFNGLNGL